MRINLLDKETKRKYKANLLVHRMFAVMYIVMLILYVTMLIFLEREVEPIIGKALFRFFAVMSTMMLPILILYYPFKILTKKYPYQPLGNVPKEVIEECNTPLIRYYKIPNNYLTTKCYDSSVQYLINQDLIIFFYKNKLRIVNDLTKTIKDFGCYELLIEEIEVYYDPSQIRLSTVIKSKDITLTLGRRAKPFIMRNIPNENS